MKKVLLFFIIYLLISIPSYSKNSEKFDVKSQNFLDLGRYVETLEINEKEDIAAPEESSDDIFEEEAIQNVAKRFEENSVELKLDDIDDSALNIVNQDRIFKLQVNESRFKAGENITNENMIWDSSKSFPQAYLNDSRHMAPIPGVVNSSSLTAKVSPSLYASMGQTYLNDANGPSVLFVRARESTYNVGSVISYKGDFLNLSAGSFSSSYNHASSGGIVLSGNSIKLPKNTGSFILGTAYYSNEDEEDNLNTGGLFGEYSYKCLKLNAQIGKSKYANSVNSDTSLYLIPELMLTDSLSLKTRLIRNVTQDTMQDELAITYKPKNSKNNFEFEINASNQYDKNSSIKQRIKFSTSFRI